MTCYDLAYWFVCFSLPLGLKFHSSSGGACVPRAQNMVFMSLLWQECMEVSNSRLSLGNLRLKILSPWRKQVGLPCSFSVFLYFSSCTFYISTWFYSQQPDNACICVVKKHLGEEECSVFSSLTSTVQKIASLPRRDKSSPTIGPCQRWRVNAMWLQLRKLCSFRLGAPCAWSLVVNPYLPTYSFLHPSPSYLFITSLFVY